LTLNMPSDPVHDSPTSHAVHLGYANVLWYDGHVGPQHLKLSVKRDGYGHTPAQIASYNLGYIVKPGCVMGDKQCEDYYYQLNKF